MRKILPIGIFLLNIVFFSVAVKADNEVWLLINTEKLNLEIKKGDKTIAIMKNVAIGRGGAGFKQYVGDDITPIGEYKIGWVNYDSRFYRFYGFDYPSVENANEALLWDLLSKKKHKTIIDAHNKNQIPPQNTAIGGRIGIHGLGAADKTIHEMLNWTHGCIALTDEQIDQLGHWIGMGTKVIIK